jgi:hypothetical protein
LPPDFSGKLVAELQFLLNIKELDEITGGKIPGYPVKGTGRIFWGRFCYGSRKSFVDREN